METDVNRQGATDAENALGTAPIGRLMLSLALPSMAAQIVNVLYNIVDRMYIGHIPVIGSMALTGLGVASPIILVVAAFAQLLGAGGAPLASMQLGGGNRERAEKILGNAVTGLTFLAVVLTVLCSVFKKYILMLFGASGNTLSYSSDYLQIYLLGSFFVMMSIGLNTYISCQGQAKIAMCSVLIGAILNIILDPVLIFIFNMGVKGAAIATVFSQAVSALWVIHFLCSDKSSIKIRRKNLVPEPELIGNMAALGLSPFIMASTESLISIVFNRQLLAYGGDLYVGAMTAMLSIKQFLITPLTGAGQGVNSIIAYNFGARRNDRVMATVKRLICLVTAVSCIGSALCILFPGVFASFFTSDEQLREIIMKMLPVYIAGIGIFGIQITVQPCFVAMGQAKVSIFLAVFRKLILLIPLAYILPCFTGLMGVYYAEPAADITSAVTAGTLFLLLHKKILERGPKMV